MLALTAPVGPLDEARSLGTELHGRRDDGGDHPQFPHGCSWSRDAGHLRLRYNGRF